MDKDELLYRRIRDFLDYRMTPEDAAAFAAQARSDTQLMEEVKLVKLEMDMERAIFNQALTGQMKAWDEEDFVPPGPSTAPSGVKWFRLVLLSAIAIAVALALFFWWPSPAPSKPAAPNNARQEPIAQKDNPVEQGPEVQKTTAPPLTTAPPPEKSPVKTLDNAKIAGLLGEPVTGAGNIRGNAGAGLLATGLEFYKNRSYESAFSEWEHVAKENEDYRGYAQQCMAYADLQMALQAPEGSKRKGLLDKSIGLFSAVLNDRDNEQVFPAAKWGLLLAYLYRDGRDSKNFSRLSDEVSQLPGYADKVEALKKVL